MSKQYFLLKRLLLFKNLEVKYINTPFFLSLPKLYTTKRTRTEQQYEFNTSADFIDSFGTLNITNTNIASERLEDEGDIQEEKFLENPTTHSRKLSTTQYANIIKKYINKRQIKEAIDVLEVTMIKEDHVKPENYIYNLILGACGRVGYTKKAFQLYNDMKKRDLQPTGGTYTALFNACANSPWSEDGLSRATKLRQQITEKRISLNDTNYNAMIKAFGRCGDIQTAFTLVDEMKKNNIPVREEVLNFLLQSCINNKEVGYLHALLVWRKFVQNSIRPNIYSYNLMLRCIRECQIGDSKVAENLLMNTKLEISSTTKVLKSNEKPAITDDCINEMKHNKNLHTFSEHATNWLNSTIVLNTKNVVCLEKMKTSEQRLSLVGGYSGYLETMQHNKVSPDIKTFTLLLDSLPNTLLAEKDLLDAMNRSHLKPDVDFLNMLIKKRNMRFDYDNARDVLDLFVKYNLRPNIFSYGILALGCATLEESRSLLHTMTNSGYRVNIEILGAMVKQACVKYNFVYVLEIMETVVRENVKPNRKFLEHLQTFDKKCMEREKTGDKKGLFWTKGLYIFKKRYSSWLKEIQPDTSENTHPWEQFRNPVETKVKNYKDVEVHFKPRVSSYYKQKTSEIKK